jgi:preprotein translocase subunit YajC
MIDFLMASAQAQEAAAAQPNPIMGILPFILIFFIFYFLMIRPQQKKIKEEQKFLDEIKVGDEVYTKSGVLGTITGLTNIIVNLEIADKITIKILRSSIGGPSKPLFEKKEEKKAK